MSTVELRMNITGIQQARAAFKAVNGDIKDFEKYLKTSNFSAREQALLWRQINRETNEAQRRVLGITQELEKAKGQGKLFEASLKGAAAGAAKLVSEAKALAGIKGPAELKQNAEDIEKALFKAQRQMAVSGETWAKMGANDSIVKAANDSGTAVAELAEGFAKVQEELSLGEQLLMNQGKLLRENATAANAMGTTFADLTRLQEQAAIQFGFGKDQIGGEASAAAKSKFTAALLQQGLQGSLSPENAPKFISSMSSFVSGTGKTGTEGALAFLARANAVKDTLGLSAAETATRSRSFLSEMASPKTQDRYKKTLGHGFLDKEGHFDDVAMADELLNLKNTKGGRAYDVAMADIFRNTRSRDWMRGLVLSREKFKGTDKAIEALSNPDIAAGQGAIDAVAKDYLNLRSTKAVVSANKVGYERLTKAGDFDKGLDDVGADVTSFEASHPYLSMFGKALWAVGSPIAGAVAANSAARAAALSGVSRAAGTVARVGAGGLAAGALMMTGDGPAPVTNPAEAEASRARMIARLRGDLATAESSGPGGWIARNIGQQDPAKIRAQLAALQGESGSAFAASRGLSVSVEVNNTFTDRPPGAVTTEVVSEKDRAAGKGRPQALPGRK